jgi:hypothetical protein
LENNGSPLFTWFIYYHVVVPGMHQQVAMMQLEWIASKRTVSERDRWLTRVFTSIAIFQKGPILKLCILSLRAFLSTHSL